MQVINNTEVFEPSECFFAIIPDTDGTMTVSITDMETWISRGCLNDCFGDHSLPDKAIPFGFSNAMEATWETELSEEDARSAMLAAGFVESQAMHDYLADCLG